MGCLLEGVDEEKHAANMQLVCFTDMTGTVWRPLVLMDSAVLRWGWANGLPFT